MLTCVSGSVDGRGGNASVVALAERKVMCVSDRMDLMGGDECQY